MKTGNYDHVFYQIRAMPSLTSAFQAIKVNESKPKAVILNGISANSWLLPIGISQKDLTQKKPRNKTAKSARAVTTSKDLNAEKEKEEEAKTEGGHTEDEHTALEGDFSPGASVQLEHNEKDCDETQEQSIGSTAKSRPMTASEFDSLWERIPKRPKSTGSVYIVRNRQLPEGIRKDEYLQGRRLPARSERHQDDEDDESLQSQGPHQSQGPYRSQFFSQRHQGIQDQRKPRPYTAPGRRYGRHRVDRICLTPSWRPMSRGNLRSGVDSCSGRTQGVDASLDLVVTSLDHHRNTHISHADCQSHETDDRDTRKLSPTANARYSGTGHAGAEDQSASTDTVEGIKRSYFRRAKSAPPNVRASSSITPSDHHDQTSSSRGPSLYWRAKSTYHKKLMAFGPDGEGLDPRGEIPNLRGSFWRPLMVPEEGGLVMQHSAGCPYKCKSCFKACLVSEDYLQKARAEKLLREKEQRRSADGLNRPTLTRHRSKGKDHGNIVSSALARSQPLYRMVHGDQQTIKGEVNSKDSQTCSTNSTKDITANAVDSKTKVTRHTAESANEITCTGCDDARMCTEAFDNSEANPTSTQKYDGKSEDPPEGDVNVNPKVEKTASRHVSSDSKSYELHGCSRNEIRNVELVKSCHSVSTTNGFDAASDGEQPQRHYVAKKLAWMENTYRETQV